MKENVRRVAAKCPPVEEVPPWNPPPRKTPEEKMAELTAIAAGVTQILVTSLPAVQHAVRQAERTEETLDHEVKQAEKSAATSRHLAEFGETLKFILSHKEELQEAAKVIASLKDACPELVKQLI